MKISNAINKLKDNVKKYTFSELFLSSSSKLGFVTSLSLVLIVYSFITLDFKTIFMSWVFSIPIPLLMTNEYVTKKAKKKSSIIEPIYFGLLLTWAYCGVVPEFSLALILIPTLCFWFLLVITGSCMADQKHGIYRYYLRVRNVGYKIENVTSHPKW